MRIHEQVYTSAERLLDGAGRSDLGVVCKSKGFPPRVEAQLEFLRTYSILRSLPVDEPSQHPARFVLAPLKLKPQQYCITRVVYAGADHTGRTTPLSHHLLFDLEELHAARVSPSLLVRACTALFLDRWQSPPELIDPPRELDKTSLDDGSWQPSPIWARMCDRASLPRIFACAAERLIAFQSEGKSVVVCTSTGIRGETGTLMTDLLAFLPRSVQYRLTCVSHVVAAGDGMRDMALTCTYPDAAFYRDTSSRSDPHAPLIVDLTGTQSFGRKPVSAYGNIVCAACEAGQLAQVLPELKELSEQLAASGAMELLKEAWVLWSDLRQLTFAHDFRDVTAAAGVLSNNSVATKALVEKWGSLYLSKRLGTLPPDKQIRMLASIGGDARWPEGIRKLVSALSTAEVGKALAEATHDDAVAIDRAAHLIRVSSPNTETAVEWSDYILTLSPLAGQRLLPEVRDRLRHAGRVNLRLLDTKASGDTNFCMYVYLPLLRELLEELPDNGEPWHKVASYFIHASLRANCEAEATTWLVKRHRAAINDRVVEHWCRQENNGQLAKLHSALSRAGLVHQVEAPDIPAPIIEVPPLPLPWRLPAFRRTSRHNWFAYSVALAATVLILLSIPFLPPLHHGSPFFDPLFWISACILGAWGLAEPVLWAMRPTPRVLPWTLRLRRALVIALTLAVIVSITRLLIMYLIIEKIAHYLRAS